jgi:hypothetical protein
MPPGSLLATLLLAQADGGKEVHRVRLSSPAYTSDADKDCVPHDCPSPVDHRDGESEAGVWQRPALKRLTRNIINVQRDEIAFMRRRQVKHAGK